MRCLSGDAGGRAEGLRAVFWRDLKAWQGVEKAHWRRNNCVLCIGICVRAGGRSEMGFHVVAGLGIQSWGGPRLGMIWRVIIVAVWQCGQMPGWCGCVCRGSGGGGAGRSCNCSRMAGRDRGLVLLLRMP